MFRQLTDKLWTTIFWLSGMLMLFILLSILAILLIKGGPSITWEFLTSSPKGLWLGVEGGIMPAIKGTAALVAISVACSAIPALFTVIYLVEYRKPTYLASILNLIIQCMVGIPSILTGLFGYAFFVLYLGLGTSLLAGSLTLSVMVFPTLVVLMRDALKNVIIDYRLAALALGVSRLYVLHRIILPAAAPGLVSAVLLAMGYAAGATAPIMVTAAVISTKGQLDLLHPVMALPYHLYIMFSQHVSLDKAYGTALTLVGLLLVLNILALGLRGAFQKENNE